ncbi:hypothetical protein [Plantactinospora sp. BC1]|uniref:hypothetical protein n=1 Tax=Plantactinospora sp. BC1 TaxID=2108470 RepID=UPI001F1E8ADF|nr:hypothetical protein [Plantactinospora sp. BC1]
MRQRMISFLLSPCLAKQGLSKKEIMRCLKRYIVREVHTALLADFTALNTP